MSGNKTWYVYLIECTDGSLYTGITVDLELRFQAHVSGKGARYTRAHPPLRMVGAEAHPDRSSALKAEFRIKQLTSAKKRAYALQMSAAALASDSAGALPQ